MLLYRHQTLIKGKVCEFSGEIRPNGLGDMAKQNFVFVKI